MIHSVSYHAGQGTPERSALRLNDKILPNVVQNKYSGDNNRYPCYNNPL